MKTLVLPSLLGVVILVGGYFSFTRISELEKRLDSRNKLLEYQTERADKQSEIVSKTLEAHVELIGKLGDLERTVGKFSDGYTNWSTIVPEVQSDLSDVFTEVGNVSDALGR